MFLIVRQSDNVIIGSAIKPINIEDASKNGYIVCEMPDAEFTPDLIGSKIEDFETWD
jgi:hypothetical protein